MRKLLQKRRLCFRQNVTCSRWANAQAHLQAAHILMWWPRIEAKLHKANPREVWVVPWNINQDGELKRKKVDYGAAHKKFRKAERRSE